MNRTTRYLMAALGAKTIFKQENTMRTYFVDYTYNTTGANFAAQYGFMRIQATSKADAISKARKSAPRNAKDFRATLQ
jgi:hypothetical protein